MGDVNAEWRMFLEKQMQGFNPAAAAAVKTAAVEPAQADVPPPATAPPAAPQGAGLQISTKTKCLYLNRTIDIERVFWEIPVIDYYRQETGVIKKQKKIVCDTPAEFEDYCNKLAQIREQNYYKDEVIKLVDNCGLAPEPDPRKTRRKYVRATAEEPATFVEIAAKTKKRVIYKNTRKLTIGMSKKDVIQKRKKITGAFYNCFALVIRFLYQTRFYEVHVKVFNTGKMEVPGRFNHDHIRVIKQLILTTLQPHFAAAADDEEPLHYISEKNGVANNSGVLINSNFNCGYYINRDKAFDLIRNKYNIEASYNSASYQGVKCKYYFNQEYGFNPALQTGRIELADTMKMKELVKTKKYTKISFMIFRTGNVMISGNMSSKVLYFVYDYIRKILNAEYAALASNEVLPAAATEVKIKKSVRSHITLSEDVYAALCLPPSPPPNADLCKGES